MDVRSVDSRVGAPFLLEGRTSWNQKIEELAGEIFDAMADQSKLFTAEDFESATYLRSYLTDKVRQAVSNPPFNFEAYKKSFLAQVADLEERADLESKISSNSQELHSIYMEDPHYRMVQIFCFDNFDTLTNLVETYFSPENFAPASADKFKQALREFIDSKYKKFYPKCPLETLSFLLDFPITSPVYPEKTKSCAINLLKCLMMSTITQCIYRNRRNLIHQTGGICYGQALLQLSTNYIRGNDYQHAATFLQHIYMQHEHLNSYFDDNNAVIGKLILDHSDEYPLLMNHACKILNCSIATLPSKDTLNFQTMIGRLAKVIIRNPDCSDVEKAKLSKILNANKSKYEREYTANLERLAGTCILNSAQDYPRTMLHTPSNSPEDVGRVGYELRSKFCSYGWNEQRKLIQLFKNVSDCLLPCWSFKGVSIDMLALAINCEYIPTIPEQIKKHWNIPGKFILTINQMHGSGHAILLEFSDKFTFFDPNFYEPIRLSPHPFEYKTLDECLDNLVLHIFLHYQNTYTSFSLQGAVPAAEDPNKLYEMRSWFYINSEHQKWRSETIMKVERDALRTRVDHSLSGSQKKELLATVNETREILEEDGKNLSIFHDKFRAVLEKRVRHYQAKITSLPSSANPLLIKSFKKVIQSYVDLIGTLCNNPTAVVRYKEVRT